jgi:autotransporter-associated beta strand protein
MLKTIARGDLAGICFERWRRFFWGLLIWGIGVASSQGATLSWSGSSGSSGNWSDSGNWGFVGVPGNGDTLIFPGGALRPSNTNDLVGLTVNDIRFAGGSGGYNLFGNSFTITNRIDATNTAGLNTITISFVLGTNDIVVNVGTAGLTLAGSLSGTVGVTKTGTGTLNYTTPGFNTYTGTTMVNAGVLALLALGLDGAFGGPLVISDGSTTATVRLLIDTEIPNSLPITINAGGLLDLNNFAETISPTLTLNNGGSIQTGTAILSLSPSATVTFNTAPLTTDSIIAGKLSVNSGTCTFNVGSGGATLRILASVSGSATINKTGPGFMALESSNSFSGTMNVGLGQLAIANSYALGTNSGGTTVSNDAQLQFIGSIIVSNEPLVMASTRPNSAIFCSSINSTSTWSGPITLALPTSVLISSNSMLTLSGVLSGPGGLVKYGVNGILTLASPDFSSSYTGDTTVNEGILLLNSVNIIRYGTLTVGDGIGGGGADIARYVKASTIYGGPGGSKVVIKSSGWLDLNNFDDDVGPVEMDGGKITTGTGTFTLFQPFSTYSTDPTNGACTFSGKFNLQEDSTFAITNPLTMSANVSSYSTYALTKTGPSHMYLTLSNSYTGPTIVQQGWLWAENAWALGGTNMGTIVSNNASLVLSGSFGITNESLTLNGNGKAADWGALDSETFGTNFWAGPITVNADSTIAPYQASTSLRIIGGISGAGGVTELSFASGTLYFDGSINNTYGGTTRVFGGTLMLNKANFDGAVPHDLIIGDGLGGTNADVVRLLNLNQIDNTAHVTISSSGLWDLNGHLDGVDALTGTGNITLGAFGGDLYPGINGASSTFDGLISGSAGIQKYSIGTFTMTANNTYTAVSSIQDGGLVINGNQPQSAVSISAGGTLGGSGTVGEIVCAGTLSPGTSPGILTSSNLTFSSGGIYQVQLTGPVAGTGYDQMNVHGTNNLANASLQVVPAFSAPVGIGTQLTIINNDLADPITGTFNGLPNGAVFSAGFFKFQINYNGGDGNDVVLTVVEVPAVQGGSGFVTSGNGNASIDPNECNNVRLVVSNKTASAMTGITATLTSTDDGVMVTQPFSSFPDAAANGTTTNLAPFQVSTLPSFACGSNVNLTLTLATATHGSFSVPIVLHSGEVGNIPIRYDVSLVTNIPDIGTIEVTNVVSGFVGPLTKAVVSLWLTHPIDSDLNISLVAPDNTVVDLSSGNGGGANFGTACSPDGNRTTFDDAAVTSITAGSSPFAGTFRPEGSLANVLNSPANGNWRLRITDNFAGSLGALRCWSLFLYPVTCVAGGGACALCDTSITITNILSTNTAFMSSRLTRNCVVSTCGALKPCPGAVDFVPRHYDGYAFYNGSSNACITVSLSAPGCVMSSAAYLNSFNPANLCENYLGDPGNDTADGQACGVGAGTRTYSFNVPSNSVFVVTVYEITAGANCGLPYALNVSGGDCRPILSALPAGPGKVNINWPTVAGYQLESTLGLSPSSFTTVPDEPIAAANQFSITNNTAPPNTRFYRLRGTSQ